MSEEADVLLDGEEETGLQEVNMHILDLGAFTVLNLAHYYLPPPLSVFLT